jgi:RNA-directed DNA polymerase
MTLQIKTSHHMEATLIEKWIKKEERVASLSKRKYLHFDRFIDFEKNKLKIIKQLSNPDNIKKHPFYPFISSSVETPRYKQVVNEDGTKKRVIESKIRPIAYASHFDALIYSWYSTILTKQYEEQLEEDWKIKDCVLAYLETGKSNIDYSLEIFSYIKSKGSCVAIAIDVSSFFDNLDHDILKKMWAKTIKSEVLPEDHFNVFKSLTKYSSVSKIVLEEIFAFRLPSDRYCSPSQFREYIQKSGLIEKNTNKNKIVTSTKINYQCGIPQGSPISSVLSNMYMIEFDIALNNFAKNNEAIYRRYCDDIILVCKIDELDKFLDELNRNINKNELTVNPKKTEITYFSEFKGKLRGFVDKTFTKFRNLQYLGFEFNGENLYIRTSSISRYKRRIASEIRECLKAANGKNSLSSTVFKKKLLGRFSSKGKRNFITYAVRAANKIMKSKTIKKQYNRSIDNVLNSFAKKQKNFNQRLLDRNIIPKSDK